MTYREACKQALRQALLDDPRVFLMGEDIARYGGCYAVTKGLAEEFGEERIRDTPLSESAYVGAGVGAAMAGMRPIVEIMTVNFSMLALDQIVNNAATIPYMSGGQFAVPLVIRMATGGGRRVAAQHSHSLDGWYAHIPGLRVLTPATIDDARYMLIGALADPNPMIVFEHVMLYNNEGALSPDAAMTGVDIDHARVRRGRDVSLVTYGGSLFKTLAAAETLAKEGIEAEVVDLRGCVRSTRRRLSRRLRRRAVASSSTRAGAAAPSRPRSACGSPKTPSSSSTRRSGAFAAARFRCPTRRISRTPACRSRRRSSRPRDGW